MYLKFAKKITDLNIDKYIHDIYHNYISTQNDKYYFDFTDVELITNQELLILSALFKSFFESNTPFEVEFLKKGTPLAEIPSRVKKQIIQFWCVWKIWKIVPETDYIKYFGIDGRVVEKIQNETNYYPKLSELYTRHGITPFISLDYINNYDESEIQKIIEPIYVLNQIIIDLLQVNNCQHPFMSKSLSTIVTEELYFNFLEHASPSSFFHFPNHAYMSISFQPSLNPERNDIQNIKSINFTTECLEESVNFFYDRKKEAFKNFPYIQFSFLDYGQGICHTLKKQYKQTHTLESEPDDSMILKYSLEHNSSRHPLGDNMIKKFIPRGLFDILTIAQRYNGLLIIRSNYGKILFDFSETNDFDKAFTTFGDSKLYFPGSLISLYIPALDQKKEIDNSFIKPQIAFSHVNPKNISFLNIATIFDKIRFKGNQIYNELLYELRKSLYSKNQSTLTFINFKFPQSTEKKLIWKSLYFLLSDYEINTKNNVVIVNLSENLFKDIEHEILALNIAIKNYKIHPLPVISYEKELKDIEIKWLGVYNEEDKKRLNEILWSDFSLAKSDFIDPNNIIGHMLDFDEYGNLLSNLPSLTKLTDLFIQQEVHSLLLKYDCIKKCNSNEIYLCNGNYYQEEFIELTSLLNCTTDCDIVSKYLFGKIISILKDDLSQYEFIGVTVLSHKILNSLVKQHIISEYISLDNYNYFDSELDNINIQHSKKYILICDVISTGFLINKVREKLCKMGISLSYIGCIIDVKDPYYSTNDVHFKDLDDKIVCLFNHPITKYESRKSLDPNFTKEIIRINPYTNIPIKLSINETKYKESVIYASTINYTQEDKQITIKNDFLDNIEESSIKIGYFKFNNLIHPYFFDTRSILKKIDKKILREIFKQLGRNHTNLQKNLVQIFYPRKSGVEVFDFSVLKNEILFNHRIEIFDIERYNTDEGWRFPHNSEYLSSKVNEEAIGFIIDDGACSGDTIIQMIDEVSFYEVKEIIFLCFIGRIYDHKREFFSRLNMIKTKNKTVKISVYFVSHWHIPTYYLDDNPIYKEQKWLQQIDEIPNVPLGIKTIANNINKEITPKSEYKYKDYKYLPKDKTTHNIPKKDILLVREEVGKVICYRLYKESFTFFDYMIRKYNEKKKKTLNRYKEIELLCAVFIYEPYLYDKITGILPDIVELLENFVRVLIYKKTEIYEMLTYEWEKKDIIHLFFIIFKNDKLIHELTETTFHSLINFTLPKESAFNYVLYKLLFYFPLTPQEFETKKYDKKLNELLDKYVKNISIDTTDNNKELKLPGKINRYHRFIQSLPVREDFISQLDYLKKQYDEQSRPEFHDEKKSFNHNVSLIIASIRKFISREIGEDTFENEKRDIRECWNKIMDFLNPILRFSNTFEGFLAPYPYSELINYKKNLIESIGFIEDNINLNKIFEDKVKMKQICNDIVNMQTNFQINSKFHQLIVNSDYDLGKFVNTLLEQVKTLDKEMVLTTEPINNIYVNIPKLYIEKILATEIITNLRKYADTYINIEGQLENKKSYVLKIVNSRSHKYKLYHGEGLTCIRHLANFEPFGFEYSYEEKQEPDEFIQKLKFNNIKDHGYSKN